MKNFIKTRFTKHNIKKVILHPLTCIFLRSVVIIITFTFLCSFMESHSITLTETEDFVLGTQFGVYFSIFIYCLLCFPFDFLSLGIYVQKNNKGEGSDNG